MLYRVTMYRPMKYERGYEACESWTVGTLRAAELTAAEKLPAAAETDYSARRARNQYAQVSRVRRFRNRIMLKAELRDIGKPVACFETPIVYVPSVGDLGWTP